MPKNFDDIIVPDRRRSIRDIPIPEGRRKADRSAPKKAASKKNIEIVEEETVENFPPARTPIPRHRRGARKKLWISLLVGLAVVAFAVLSMLNGATLNYSPKSAALAFNAEAYAAYKSGSVGPFYSVVKLSREKGLAAPAGTEQEVSRKASGTIIIYNDGAESQRLVENTRFESPSGKIYRIQAPVTVPAKKTAGGASQPGTVEATVYADQPGVDYNSAPTDFTVPGLKGTSKYTTVYGRSKTPIAGGFVGKEKVVKPEDLSKAKKDLQAALTEELYVEAEAEVPQDFILFRTLTTFSFEDMPQTAGSNGSVNVNLRGNLYGIMFKKSDLSSFFAQKKLAIPASDKVEIPDLKSLNVTFVSVPSTDLVSLNEVNFKVTGNAKLLWTTDEVALKADLAGKSKDEVAGILKNYPTIASASVTVRPFWKSAIPKEAEKIKVNKLSAE